MAKDVVYIDIKDDITSIIDKVKQSEQKIVALVPPKQIGALQSAVNLQLLVHEAKRHQKVLVIITGQDSLIRLAAVAGVPVAKTLTSKPEMPEIPALKVDGEDDIIDGTKIGIGEMAGVPTPSDSTEQASSEVGDAPKLAPTKIKVPNYDKFRKRLFIGIALFAGLVVFLVWAFVFAPRAEIVISTTSKALNISSGATLVEKADQQKLEENILVAQTQKMTKKRTYEFSATGEKELQIKATGEITITKSVGTQAARVPAGTIFTGQNQLKFISLEDVNVPGVSEDESGNRKPGVAKVSVQAAAAGEDYNVGSQNYSVGGFGQLSASGSQMSGGVKRTIKVMTQEDYDKAKTELTKGGNDAALKELRNKFDSSTTLINESLTTSEGEIKVSSKVDEEAVDGKVKMEQENSYQITGITNKVLTEYLSQIALRENKKSKVYDAGLSGVVFKDFVVSEGKMTVRIASQVKIGPDIDTNAVKEFVKNKQQSEIRSQYLAVDGVRDVRVSFSPFWVKAAPNNLDKITVVVEN